MTSSEFGRELIASLNGCQNRGKFAQFKLAEPHGQEFLAVFAGVPLGQFGNAGLPNQFSSRLEILPKSDLSGPKARGLTVWASWKGKMQNSRRHV